MSSSTSTSSHGLKKLTLNLLIDKAQNRVILAEASSTFVDILFSFLTLPLGTIIRLLNASSSFTALENIYKSIQSLPDTYFQTPPCKTMLLSPRNSSGIQCGRLFIRPDDHEHRIYYRCATRGRQCMVSCVAGVECGCGRVTEVPFAAEDTETSGEGVFVKEGMEFMISDDLEVRPVSMTQSLAWFRRMGVEDGGALEKKTVVVGRAEILGLLKRSLVSSTPLTDVFLEESNLVADAAQSLMRETSFTRERQQSTTPECKKISVKLFLSKDSDKVVYAEASENFVNLIFGFLTFPLGSIVNILEKRFIGCIGNLYKSVEILSQKNSYMKSENRKKMLLEPELAPYFGCSNQLLRTTVEEKQSEIPFEMNPKMKNSGRYGGSFSRGIVGFMVTDEMLVTPFSSISAVSIINQLKVPIGSLEEVEMIIGESEAINLLRACLISPTALSAIFSPTLLTLMDQKWYGKSPGN